MWAHNKYIREYIGKGKRTESQLLEMWKQEDGAVFWFRDGHGSPKGIEGKQTGRPGSQTETSMRLLPLNCLSVSGIGS
jgi:hypothetical protein